MKKSIESKLRKAKSDLLDTRSLIYFYCTYNPDEEQKLNELVAERLRLDLVILELEEQLKALLSI